MKKVFLSFLTCSAILSGLSASDGDMHDPQKLHQKIKHMESIGIKNNASQVSGDANPYSWLKDHFRSFCKDEQLHLLVMSHDDAWYMGANFEGAIDFLSGTGKDSPFGMGRDYIGDLNLWDLTHRVTSGLYSLYHNNHIMYADAMRNLYLCLSRNMNNTDLRTQIDGLFQNLEYMEELLTEGVKHVSMVSYEMRIRQSATDKRFNFTERTDNPYQDLLNAFKKTGAGSVDNFVKAQAAVDRMNCKSGFFATGKDYIGSTNMFALTRDLARKLEDINITEWDKNARQTHLSAYRKIYKNLTAARNKKTVFSQIGLLLESLSAHDKTTSLFDQFGQRLGRSYLSNAYDNKSEVHHYLYHHGRKLLMNYDDRMCYKETKLSDSPYTCVSKIMEEYLRIIASTRNVTMIPVDLCGIEMTFKDWKNTILWKIQQVQDNFEGFRRDSLNAPDDTENRLNLWDVMHRLNFLMTATDARDCVLRALEDAFLRMDVNCIYDVHTRLTQVLHEALSVRTPQVIISA